MNYTKYHNCLRLQITMDDNADTRIEEAAAHCVKYGFDNVMLMLNAEEFNLGHITLEEAKPWVALLKKAKARFEAAGIVVSVNHWIEIGHLARGRKLKEGQNFTTMVDRRGYTEPLVACPLDEEWRKYHCELITYFVQELQPDTYWIEDDFRLHNHGEFEGIGCFCEKHLARYNALLGKEYTREELVEKIFAVGECSPERKAWLDINRQTMVETMEVLVNAVRKACPTTDVGLMSSAPECHTPEARDWHALFSIMAGEKGRKIHRIHLPQYFEESGKGYLYEFNRISMMIRALSDEDCVIMPETENGNASFYRKSPRYMQFILEAALPLVLSGMTYSIYDFVGNGVRESMGYGQVVKKLQPYMQAVEDLRLRFSCLQGVVIPIDEKAAYKREIAAEGWRDLAPWEYRIAAFLSAQGVSYRYSKEKAFQGETVFLCGASLGYLSDGQVKAIFANNYVLLEGSALLSLEKRGLLSLVGAKSAALRVAETGYQSYEECTDGSVIDGVKNLRASCRLAAGDFVEVEYAQPVTVHTTVFDHTAKALAPAIAEREGVYILPYLLDGKPWSQFCDLRRHYLLQILQAHSSRCAISENVGISPYYYEDGEKRALVLVNGNVDTFKEITLKGNLSRFGKILCVGKDGKTRKVAYKREGERIRIKTKMEGLSSIVLIFS